MKRSSTTINYRIGLNKLVEVRIVDNGSTEVFRPDSEVGDEAFVKRLEGELECLLARQKPSPKSRVAAETYEMPRLF